ncbi:hypothetical protein JTB14_017079 [Gonioctena quinquepunctata]|nr:hypothetical protein JTB14_017079 [Gonioctena quinquepunctata]
MNLKKEIGSCIRKAKARYSADPVWPLDLRTQFDEQGFNDWKNAEIRVALQENSLNHKSCILALRARGLASRGLAFRGSNGKFGDQHNGKTSCFWN